MDYFECKIANTPLYTAALLELDRTEKVPFEHYYIREDKYVLALSEEHISILEAMEVPVEKGVNLIEQAAIRKSERAPASRDVDDDGDDAITTQFVDHYMDKVEIYDRFETMAMDFPALCQLSTLPFLTEGYDGSETPLLGPSEVKLLRITTTPGIKSKPALLLICGTHAREWVNPLVAVEFAEQLLRNYDPASIDPDVIGINRIVEEGDILIVPVMNPDGYNYSFYDYALWRKNRRINATPSCPGVDNNRNYGIFFGQPGSSGDNCSDTYRGTSAFSEPENKNIKYILEQYPNILIGVDSHSRGRKIFRPHATGGGFTSSLPLAPEDEVIYQDLENAANAAINGVSGSTYLTGTTSNHAGTSDEYLFFGHRIFGFDFECALSFQPAIASALVAVQEVTAALRALATKAIDLEVAPSNPISVVQCIDRTSSMVSFGYESGAKSNARRFVDLMSIGDNIAVVSFADPSSNPATTPPGDRAQLEYPFTEISHPGIYGDASDEIDDINFYGWTSIGAGLQLAATQFPAGSTLPKSILLISDGYENRDPSVSSILGSIPSDVSVYTIALGSAADTDLLQHIATETGGQFYLSPDILDLHEIYNQIRADVSDDDMVLTQKVIPQTNKSNKKSSCHHFNPYVEQEAFQLTVSLSWMASGLRPSVVLIDPDGVRLPTSGWKVEKTQKDNYLLLKVFRPKPGRWTVYLSELDDPFVISAFVRSSLKLNIRGVARKLDKKLLAYSEVKVQFRNQPITEVTGMAEVYLRQPRNLAPQFKARYQLEQNEKISNRMLNILKQPEIERDFCNFGSLRPTAFSMEGNIQSIPRDSHALPHFIFSYPNLQEPAVYNVRIKIEGKLPTQGHFERVVISTLTLPGSQSSGPGKNTFWIRGKVQFKSGKAAKDLVVVAKDKDLIWDDRLGSALTAEDGTFQLSYQQEDFQSILKEKLPDLYIQVLSHEKQLIYTSEKEVRYEAGKEEWFDILI